MRRRLPAVLLLLIASEVCAASAGALPTPPPDWKLEVVAAAPRVRHPSVVCCAPGGEVFVAEDPMDISLPSADLARGRILCFHPDGSVTTFADNLHAVFGMQYLDGKLYVLHNPRFSVFTVEAGVGTDRRDLIQSTNPNPWALDWNDHVPANFRLGMDGYFYVAVGDKGLFNCVGTDGRRVDLRGGGVVRLRPDGTELEVFSTGVRNILDVAMNEEDEIFTYDNTDENQWMGRLTHMVDGGFYGYPWDFIPRRPYTLWMMADYGAGAATGALCYNEDALPDKYHGNLFLADFGKRNILRVKIERDGATYKAVSREDLFTDVPADFRPVGICLSPDGTSIYVCDWQHADTKENVDVGRLLKLTYTGETGGKPKPSWFVAAASGKPFKATRQELIATLSHSSLEVRMVAQRRLADRGAESVEELSNVLGSNGHRATTRTHAFWALDAIDGSTALDGVINIALTDIEPRIRREALRQIGTRKARDYLGAVIARMSEHDADVRFHAATAAGRIADPSAVPKLQKLLADGDPWVRHATWTALNRIGLAHPDRWETIAAGLKSPDAARREGTSFALRSTYDPQLVKAVAALARRDTNSPESRAAAIRVLGSLHHKLPEWKGEWWAYHPALAQPPRKTVAWEGTEQVLFVLGAALEDPDRDVALAAVDALHEAGDASAAERIRGLFTRATDPELKRRALAALGTCDDQRSIRFLMEQLGREAAFDAGVMETLGRLRAVAAIPMLVGRARAPSERTRAAAFEALVRIGGEAAFAAVSELLDHRSLDVRRAAVRAAGELGDRAAIPKLLVAYAARETRDPALVALAQMPDARATGAYLEGLASTDFTVRERCKQAMREVRDAALPEVEEAAGKGVSDEVVLELRQIYNDHEKAKKGRLFSLPVTRKHPDEYLHFSVNNTGDARAGEKLFVTTTEGGIGCATCHAANGRGGTVGPDLSGVGAKFSRRDLAEAVLYPSKAVREGYQQVIVRTKNGQTYAGAVKAQTPEELTLHESDGTLRRIAVSDVAARKDSGLSPMPDNLHAGLSPQQFTDLVSYLESLKTEPRNTGVERK